MSPELILIEKRIDALKEEIRERMALVGAYQQVAKDLGCREEAAPQGEEKGQSGDKVEPAFSWQSDKPSAAVRNAIRHMDSNYTLNQIDAWLRHNGYKIERDTISFVLSRFAKAGEIEILEKGAGKRATLFAAPSPLVHNGGIRT